MPRQTEIEKIIPAIYQRSALNLLLFGYVRGARSSIHTLTIAEAVDMFMADFGLTDDTYNRASALTTYNRMQKELVNSKHTRNV